MGDEDAAAYTRAFSGDLGGCGDQNEARRTEETG
jgi:hypothetical protein